MKKLLSLALLVSFVVPNSVLAAGGDNTIYNAGTEQSVEKKQRKYYLKTEKIKPSQNKYDYVNMAWWAQFNDEYLNDYIIKAVENNKDLKMATLTIDEYYQNVVMQRASELPSIQAGFMPGYGKFMGKTQGSFGLPIIANYELDLFGKNHNKTTSMRKIYEASILDEKSAYISIASAVGSVYLNIVKLDAIIDKQEEIYSVLNTGREYSICEFLPGTEYTVDCFTDRYGVLRVCQPRVRERIKMGIAVRSSLCPLDEEIAGIANIINRKLVFNGAWFFQLKKNLHEEYKLLEISPRIPGTMGASRNLGINFPLLTLFNMWEYDVDIIDNHLDITLDRAFINRYRSNLIYDIVYLDFDDTLYLHDKINICLMAFCYQCVNKHIPIILLTKHSEDIYEALSLFKISSDMFEKIIHINHRQNKADYIKGEHPILIDDSFAERQNVLNQLGIAVYDLDMVESLLDWRM